MFQHSKKNDENVGMTYRSVGGYDGQTYVGYNAGPNVATGSNNLTFGTCSGESNSYTGTQAMSNG